MKTTSDDQDTLGFTETFFRITTRSNYPWFMIPQQSNNLIQINLGPQHPSTHGVLRIIGFVECETIKSVEPELGLLHRGSEKLIEYRCQNKSLPYFNRLDYVSLLAQEEIQVQAEEKLLNLRISSTGSALRTTQVEISILLVTSQIKLN